MSLQSTDRTKNRIKNYKVFVWAEAFTAFAMGLFAPYWIIFVKDFVVLDEYFGVAIGIMILAKSLTSWFVGILSDRIGRKILMVIALFVTSGVVISYTLVNTLTQLYILQMLIGITIAIHDTIKLAFLGDVTKKESRGKDMGRLEMIAGLVAAAAMMAGGFSVKIFGIDFIFYVVAGFFVISGFIILLLIKEER